MVTGCVGSIFSPRAKVVFNYGPSMYDPRKFQFSEKWQNRNFGKNPKKF